MIFYTAVLRRCVGMADDADSKSVVGNHVRVQVPPPALRNAPSNDGAFLNLVSEGLEPIQRPATG